MLAYSRYLINICEKNEQVKAVSSCELYTGYLDTPQRSKMRQISLQKVIESIVGSNICRREEKKARMGKAKMDYNSSQGRSQRTP